MCGTESEHAQFTASFRYFGNLPKLLKRRYRVASIEYRFKAHPGVKDAIESMGIPHTEVDVVLANGRSVDFCYQLQNLDAIDVYPFHCAVPAEGLAVVARIRGDRGRARRYTRQGARLERMASPSGPDLPCGAPAVYLGKCNDHSRTMDSGAASIVTGAQGNGATARSCPSGTCRTGSRTCGMRT